MSENKLAKLKARKAAVVPEGKGLNAMESVILSSMAESMTQIGAVSSAKTGKDWAYSEVHVIPGVTVSARMPPGHLVEMDGFALVSEMVNAAERVLPSIMAQVNTENQHPHRVGHAHKLLGIERGEPWSRKTATVAVVKMLLSLQDWKFVPSVNRWRSPVWLFPPVMLKWEALEAMVKEEIDYREGDVQAISADPLDVLEEG